MQTAILLGLVYAFAWSMDNIAGSSFMDRPIVCGALTGLVMGNFEQGLVIGGTLELVWMGFISYAGIINGETRIGAILGTYFALATGNSFDVAISIAMPIAILGGNVSNAYNIVVSYLMHRWADKWAEEGNYKKIGQFHLGVGFVKLFFMTAIVFLTVLLGTGAITSLINVIPENVLNGLGKAGEMLTAVGFGMLLNILWDKRFIGLYFVGFAVAAFLNLNVIAITIIATGLGFVAMYASGNEIYTRSFGAACRLKFPTTVSGCTICFMSIPLLRYLKRFIRMTRRECGMHWYGICSSIIPVRNLRQLLSASLQPWR